MASYGVYFVRGRAMLECRDHLGFAGVTKVERERGDIVAVHVNSVGFNQRYLMLAAHTRNNRKYMSRF